MIGGAGEKLARFAAILSEVPRVRLYEGSPSFTESVETLEQQGFNLARLYPVHPHVVLETYEFNAYFVNELWSSARASSGDRG